MNRASRSGIAGERVGQDLQRDVAIELRVAGPIHLPHAAFADLRGDFVDAEAGAGSEGQTCGLYGRGGSADGITLGRRSVRLADACGGTSGPLLTAMLTELSSWPFDHQIQQLPDRIHRKIDIHPGAIAKLSRPLLRLAQLPGHLEIDCPPCS